MPRCQICNREFAWRGSNPYGEHIKTKHPIYWKKMQRANRAATMTLGLSIILTFALATLFFSADQTGFTIMGLAVLFLAISSAFTLWERSLANRFKLSENKGGKTSCRGQKPRHRSSRK